MIEPMEKIPEDDRPYVLPPNVWDRLWAYFAEAECECDKSTAHKCEACSLIQALEALRPAPGGGLVDHDRRNAFKAASMALASVRLRADRGQDMEGPLALLERELPKLEFPAVGGGGPDLEGLLVKFMETSTLVVGGLDDQSERYKDEARQFLLSPVALAALGTTPRVPAPSERSEGVTDA